MQLVHCPHCGKIVANGQAACPGCGAQVAGNNQNAIAGRLAWVADIMGEPELLGADTPILDERVPETYRTCPACGSYRVVLEQSGTLLKRLFAGAGYVCLGCGNRQRATK